MLVWFWLCVCRILDYFGLRGRSVSEVFKFIDGKGNELCVKQSSPDCWVVNDKFGLYLQERYDEKRGCLFLDMDKDSVIIREYLNKFGVGGCYLAIVGSGFSFSGPVVWSSLYFDGIVLLWPVSKLVDLDHFGDLVTVCDKTVLGFCSPEFNFRHTCISIIKTSSRNRSATDIQIVGFVIRSGEVGYLSAVKVVIYSKDKIFDYVREIIDCYI